MAKDKCAVILRSLEHAYILRYLQVLNPLASCCVHDDFEALFDKASSTELCFHTHINHPSLLSVLQSIDGCVDKCHYGFCSRRGSKWD